MPISLSESARYTTQSGIWGTQFLGELTDRRIEKYALEGRYGAAQKHAAEMRKRASKKSQRTRVLEALLPYVCLCLCVGNCSSVLC